MVFLFFSFGNLYHYLHNMESDFSHEIDALQAVKITGSITCTKTQATVPTTAGALVLESWAPNILRVRLGLSTSPDYGLITPKSNTSKDAIHRQGQQGIQLGEFTVNINSEPLAMSIRVGSKQLLGPPTDAHFVRNYRIAPFAVVPGKVCSAFDLHDDERLFGTGEQWASLDLRGLLINNYNTDSLGGNTSQSYKNIPFIWSSQGWGIFHNTPAPARHALGYPALAHRSFISIVEDALDLFIFHGETPLELLEAYHRLTGLPGNLPNWALGPWLSRAYYRTADELLDSARQMRQRKLPCTTIVLDGRTWLDTKTRFAFEWDKVRYPDPAAVLDELHELGYKVCAWVYPLVSVANPQYDELVRQDIFIKGRDGNPYIYKFSAEPFGKDLSQLPDSSLVDFTNPIACEWWKEGCRSLLNQGIDAIKTDFGEQIPDDTVAANGDTGRRLHNVYALLYNRTTHEAFKGTGKAPVLWARSAWSGSQAYPGHWCGDSQSDWGGFRTAIRGCLQWMLSGGGYTGSDIGGFYGGPPSAELYVRWFQFGALSSLMRMHGIGEREPYAYGKRAEKIARQWLHLRYRLLPYLERTAAQAAERGLPTMRPMPLLWPDESPHERTCDLQYMLGDDLLCAPVTNAGGKVRCWLPPGRWLDYFRGRFLRGNRWMERKCKLDEMPLFVRQGATVELADDKATSPNIVELLVVGTPKQGEHANGVKVTMAGEQTVLYTPSNWTLDCRGCQSTSYGKMQYWVIS